MTKCHVDMIENDQQHAAYDALNVEQFDRLYAATFDGDDDYETELENRFIVAGSGRLTLRRGELLHFNPDWIDRETKLLKIPPHVPCDCSYCEGRAEDFADDRDMTTEEALESCWSPKTSAGVRAIYYGWSPLTIDAVEQFADVVGELEMDPSTINRRVDRLAERAHIKENIYPHALRASSAFFWADMGLEAAYLQAIMGWNSIEVAVAYLRASGYQLAQRIERAFAVGDLSRPEAVPQEDVLPPSEEAIDQTPKGGKVSPRTPPLREFTEPADS